MVLSDIDRNLLERCLALKPRSWEDFVDRFVGLIIHVINHTAQARSIRLSAEDREDLSADVLLAVTNDNFAVLRHFRGESSLATYLTVVARRVVVRELLKRKTPAALSEAAEMGSVESNQFEQRIEDREEVERLLRELGGIEAQIVRMYHLDGKSYQEISREMDVHENSVGPTLSRARAKMRKAGADSSS